MPGSPLESHTSRLRHLQSTNISALGKGRQQIKILSDFLSPSCLLDEPAQNKIGYRTKEYWKKKKRIDILRAENLKNVSTSKYLRVSWEIWSWKRLSCILMVTQ